MIIPVLTERSYRQVRSAVHAERDAPRPPNRRQRRVYDQEIPPLCIFKIPAGGIAARDDDVVSSADCFVYKLQAGNLTEIGGQRPLWNFDTIDLSEGDYVIGVPDAWGQYIYFGQLEKQCLIKAPSGGIPQRVGTLLGSATCDVWGIGGYGQIVDTNKNITVKNWGVNPACANGDRYGFAEFYDGVWWIISEDCSDSGSQISASFTLTPNETGENDDFTTTSVGTITAIPRSVTYTPPAGVTPT